MKKFISIILVSLLMLSVIFPCFTALGEETRKQSVLKTSKQIAALCNEYDNYSNSNGGDKIDNRLIVKTDTAIDEYGAVNSIYGFGYAFLQYTNNIAAKKALNYYKNSGYIANYDSLVTCMDSADHDQWGDDWAYERVDSDSAIDYYKLKVKSNINIAVVDSGINYNHELFKNRIIRTKYNISTTGTKDDEIDDFGHGTEVSGVIANSTPSNVKISSYKVINNSGKSNYSTVISACSYIMALSNKPNVVNFSLGFKDGGIIMETVVDELVNSGITVVAAAGNDNREVYETPAKCENAITVAAFNYYDKPCSFTNYGKVVDVSAPGEYIHTADMSSNSAYTFVNGTSFATPITAAACAYVLMENGKYTPEQVKQELIKTAIPFKKSECFGDRYGAGIVNFSNIISGTRCKDVTANLNAGVYHDDISVELKCANSLVDIYYTTDGTLPSKTNGTKYTEPVKLTESTRINAVAFARAGTPFHSKFTTLDYYIFKNDESEFVVDDGTYWCGIKAYIGNDTDITIPDKINGIEVGSIKEGCFKNSNIESVTLPSSVTAIEQQAFYGCDNLKSINLSNVKSIGTEAFTNCPLLTNNINLSSVNRVDNKGLAGTYFKTIALPACESVGDSAFESCVAQEITLNKATDLGDNAFKNCSNLETLYIPMATSLDRCDGCTNLQTIFAPMLESIIAGIPNNTTIYCTRFLSHVTFPDDFSEYEYTFVSPRHTSGLIVANYNGYQDRYNHICSDSIGESLGAQIRTRDNGLRFGFKLDDNNIGFDFKKYANTVDYGFVYTYKSLKDKDEDYINDFLQEFDDESSVKSAAKRNVDGTVSTYNAVFTSIPAEHINDEISARAYVNVDGMYFYSPVMISSYNDVQSQAEDSLDDNDIEFDHTHSYTVRVIKPSCENEGYTLYKCSCGNNYSDSFVNALGHNYKFKSFENGVYNYQCSDCGTSKSINSLPQFVDYVNTKATRNDDSMYLDLNNDGFVNAKDYSIINKNVDEY